MTTKSISIHWFRQDLRIEDNPALNASARTGDVIPIYIFDTGRGAERTVGGAGKVWLHHSLKALNKSLNGALRCFTGDPLEILQKLTKDTEAKTVTWNRLYEPSSIERDKIIKSKLVNTGTAVLSFGGSLLWEPWETLKADGTPYKVFTPFFRRGCLNASPPRIPVVACDIELVINVTDAEEQINQLKLLDGKLWEDSITEEWHIGELGAKQRLTTFINNGIDNYKDGRNFPMKTNVSRLSPYLHWGEISVSYTHLTLPTKRIV